MDKIINILGTQYTVKYIPVAEDKNLKERDGYTDFYSKLIVIENSRNGNINDLKRYMRKVLRHEITHAFLYESGLAHNSFTADMAWAMSEEMVDWFAIQGEKIYKVWREAGALDIEGVRAKHGN